MKKYILLFAVIFLPLLVSAQSKQLKDQYNEYTKNGYYKKEKNVIVVQEVMKGLTGGKDQIYAKAKAFVENQFKTVNSEVFEDNSTTGVYELSTYYRGLSQWKHEGKINTEISAYIIVRVEAKATSARVTIESDAWNVRMGQGRSKKELEGEIVKYAPLTGKKLVDNAKQTEAFINLINTMYETLDGVKAAVTSNKAPTKTSKTSRNASTQNDVNEPATTGATSRSSVTSRTNTSNTSNRNGAATSGTRNATSRNTNTSRNANAEPAPTSRTSRTTSTAPSTSRTSTRNQQVEDPTIDEDAPTPRSSRSSSTRSYSSPRTPRGSNSSAGAAAYDQSRQSRPKATTQSDDDDF